MSIFKWIFENIAPGETTAAKRVDADRLMDNFYTLERGTGVMHADGEYAVDGNSNGNSTATQCNITVYTEQGEGGLLYLNDAVTVTDGTNVWNLVNTLADNELSFNDTHLASGSGPADYSDPAFIDSLDIDVKTFKDVFGKDQLILDGSHAEKLTGADIQTSGSDTTKLGTAVTNVQAQVDVDHESDGSHKTDVIAIANIDKAALIEENDGNLVFGMMEDDWDLDGYANGWKAYNDPISAELSTDQSRFGDYSQKIVASQPEDGIVNNTDECPLDPDRYAGRYITAAAYVYCTSDDMAKIEIYDGVGTTTSAAGGTASAWERIYVTRQIDAAATDLQIRIYATEATTFYIDEVHVGMGQLAAGFIPHASEQLRSEIADASLTNYCPNSDFECWSSGSAVGNLPDFWAGSALVTRGTPPIFEPYCAAVALDPGEDFYMKFGAAQGYHLDHFLEREVYFNAYVILDSGTTALRMTVDDGVTSSYTGVVPGAAWNRRGVKHLVDANATQLKLSFSNPGPSAIQVRIDGVMLTADSYPMGYKPTTVYKPWTLVFGLGTIASGYMGTSGNVQGEVRLPFRGLIQSLHVIQGTAPTSPTTVTYTVWVEGAAQSNYAVSFGNGDLEKSIGVKMENATSVPQGDSIGVKAAVVGGAPGANAIAVVTGITWV